MRRQQSAPLSQEEPTQKIPNLAQLTPYDVMRMQNCKGYKFRKSEMYPSIRPPVSQCNPSKTIAWFSKTMDANGCGCVDTQLLNRKYKSSTVENTELVSKNVLTGTGKDMFNLCKMNNQRRQQTQNTPERGINNMLDWSKVTPYDFMRMQNCKTFKFLKCETYPSIKPPVSQCSTPQTAEWLADVVEDAGCGRYFDMEQDDVMDVWRESPNKQTLSYYGVASAHHQPEALMFNRVIARSLEKATAVKPASRKPEVTKPQIMPYASWPCGKFVLNRQLLQAKVTNMPTVQKKIAPSEAFTMLHCPQPTETVHPFLESQPKVALTSALDMDRPVPKPKHGLRRKHKYCELQCHIPENKCTDYEWRKYKQDPKPIEAAFEKEMEEMEKGEPEPRNYDELYSHLVTCFETEDKDPLCDYYEKCCMPPPKHAPEVPSGGSRVPEKGVHRRPPRVPRPADDDGPEKPVGHKPKIPKPPSLVGAESGDGTQPEKPVKEKPIKEKPVKEKPVKEKPKKEEKPEKEKPVKPVKEKPEKPVKEKPVPIGTSEADYPPEEKKPPKEGKPDKPGKKTPVEEPPPTVQPEIVPGDQQPPAPVPSTKPELPKQPRRPTEGKEKPPKKHPKKPKKPKQVEPPVTDPCSPANDCPCEICEFMKRRQKESDTPLIRQLKQEEKRRQLRDYYKRMCHREYLKWRKPEYHAPQHKCDGIVCDNFFCQNPKLGEYCECLDAMQKLQKLLGPKHRIVKNELIFNVEDLRRRICRRFCDCL
ncbi:proteoglycan 4-like [Drosophila novamexicana]|uniref:proteoglycan 4-like n=1 Tax=Drosophila novamexicana TaxID=47314 RepID=UPI0011E5F3E9|nr:proteoglycan 4-like [Drosophila novamexicana]